MSERDWDGDELTAQYYKRSVQDIHAVDLSDLKRIIDITIAALAERKRLADEVDQLESALSNNQDALAAVEADRDRLEAARAERERSAK